MAFKKVIDRQRAVPGLYSVTDVSAGQERIQDIPSNINVEGTRIDAELLNSIQKGLIFEFDTINSIENGRDIYSIEIPGLISSAAPNDYPLQSGMTFQIKINTTSTQDQTILRINGDNYDFAKVSKLGVVALETGDLIEGMYYNITYDGTLFIVENFSLPARDTTAGITQYGTEEMSALEGHRLAQILGVKYGGEIQIETTKEEGKAYYDQTTMYLYLCTETNTLNYADLSKYKAFSNFNLLNEIDDLKTTVIQSIALPGITELYLEKKGDIAILSIDSGTAFDGRTSGQVLFTLPVGWRPSHNIHMALVPGVGQTQTVPVVVKPNGEAIFIGSGTLSQPKYGSITYFVAE